MCCLGPLRKSARHMQQRQECVGLGRFVSLLQQKLLYSANFFSIGLTDFCCVLVDEEDEYECVTVVNSHTQDVKHVVWHPTQEVGLFYLQ